MLQAFNTDAAVVRAFDLKTKEIEMDRAEIQQFLMVMEKLDANPEHNITWSQFLMNFGQTQQNIETLLRLYTMPKHMREAQGRGATDRWGAQGRAKQRERIQAMSTKMTDAQMHALRHIFHRFKKADSKGMINIMDLLMAMRDDGSVRHLFELFDQFEEVDDEDQRRFGQIIDKLESAGDGKQHISWDEFMSYFGQNRYDFRGLMMCLQPTSLEAEQRIHSAVGKRKNKSAQAAANAGGAAVVDVDSDDSMASLPEDGLLRLEDDLDSSDSEPEYMVGRAEVADGKELEIELGSTPFENYLIYAGNTNRKLFGPGEARAPRAAPRGGPGVCACLRLPSPWLRRSPLRRDRAVAAVALPVARSAPPMLLVPWHG